MLKVWVNLEQLKYFVIIAFPYFLLLLRRFRAILFIGIVVPHFSRMIYSPSKLWQQWILNMILEFYYGVFFSIFQRFLNSLN